MDGSHLPATSGGGGQMRRDFFGDVTPGSLGPCRTGLHGAAERGNPWLIGLARSRSLGPHGPSPMANSFRAVPSRSSLLPFQGKPVGVALRCA